MSRLVFPQAGAEVGEDCLYGADFGRMIDDPTPKVFLVESGSGSGMFYDFQSPVRALPILVVPDAGETVVDLTMRNVVSEMKAQARCCHVGILYRTHVEGASIISFSLVAVPDDKRKLLAMNEDFDAVEVFS